MVKRVLAFLSREVRGLHYAAFVLAFFTLLSQILALFRDRLLASTFGAGEVVDLYYAAFRIPDLIFAMVASLVSAYALIPLLNKQLSVSLEEARKGIEETLTGFLVVSLPVVLLALVFTEDLVQFLLPGFVNSVYHEDFIMLTRIMLVQPVLLGISGVVSAVVQTHHRMLVFATAPLLYNLGIILGITVFFDLFGIPGLGVGVLVGAALHLLVQLPTLHEVGFSLRVGSPRNLQSFKALVLTSFPRALALSSTQVVFLALTSLASFMIAGSLAAFSFAYNLQAVPLSLIATAYSVAAFPTLAAAFANGEKKKFRSHLETALRHVIIWSLVSIALLIVLRAYVVRGVLGAGAFSWEDTRITAALLAVFAVSIIPQSVVAMFARACYAAGKSFVPLFAAIVGGLSAIGAAWFVTQNPYLLISLQVWLKVEDLPNTAVLALPLGFLIGMTIQALILFLAFLTLFGGFSRKMLDTLFLGIASAMIGGGVAYLALGVLEEGVDTETALGIILMGGISGTLGAVAALGILALAKSAELWEIVEAVRRKLTGTK